VTHALVGGVARALAESYVRRAEMLRAEVAVRQGVMPLAVVDVLRGEDGVGWEEG
jgi:hypothetical protein